VNVGKVGNPHFSAYSTASYVGEIKGMKNEFTLAFNEVLEEKGLPKEIILKALESAMVSAYRRAVNASTAQSVEAHVDIETGKVTISAEKEVVEEVQDDRTEVTLENARLVNPEAELGAMVMVESTPTDFGRVAAQTARQVIQQRIRDAEHQSQTAFFEKQIGEIVSGTVQAINAQGLTIGMEMKAEGSMPRKEMIPGERFRIHDRVRTLIAEVKETPRGPQIILSRTHRNFLRRLLENEVPEIFHGVVEIRSIAREPGQRAKVAVSTSQTGIDPVGACVGVRGVRIQTIVRELHDEKIDVIEWNADPAVFIAKAISPARVSGVYLNESSANGKTATVVVPEDQLSLAIGRDGQNARLAAKLTGWRIDIKSLPEAAADVLYKLQNDPGYQAIAEVEAENIPIVEAAMAKKAENRALTPEEYEVITRFVDRIEKRATQRLQAEKKSEAVLQVEYKSDIPESAFQTNILDGSLPEHVAYIIQEAGISTVGELAVKMLQQPDDILRLQGIGPKAMAEIQKLMETLKESAQAVKVEETTAVAAPAAVEEAVEVSQPAVEAELVESGETVSEPVAAETEPSLEIPETHSLDEIFTLKPEVFEPTNFVDEEQDNDPSKDKKKGKKKSTVTITFDPDRGTTTATKKHKHDRFNWGDWEE
jgi:N utilization substance protein A